MNSPGNFSPNNACSLLGVNDAGILCTINTTGSNVPVAGLGLVNASRRAQMLMEWFKCTHVQYWIRFESAKRHSEIIYPFIEFMEHV